jgi:hypothetical protein
MRVFWGVVGAVLFPAMTVSGESGAPACVGALEQVATVKTRLPNYKFTVDGRQEYIKDTDRPAEFDRLQKVIDASCSAIPETRSSEESAAQRLHVIRSPHCTAERDKLAFMGKPGSHDPPDSIAQQHPRVIEGCAVVETPVNVWLLQMWVRPR